MVYDVNGNTLTAYVEVSGAGYQAGVDRAVFTLTVNAAGEFTFTLIDQIDHLPNVPANDDTQTLVLNLSSAIRFTDFDGDSVVLANGLSITIQDDIPKLGTIEDGSMSNNASASFTGDMPVDIGADEPAKASLLGNVAPADLTSGGLPVHYYVDPADPDTLVAYTGANPADASKLGVHADGRCLDRRIHVPHHQAARRRAGERRHRRLLGVRHRARDRPTSWMTVQRSRPSSRSFRVGR